MSEYPENFSIANIFSFSWHRIPDSILMLEYRAHDTYQICWTFICKQLFAPWAKFSTDQGAFVQITPSAE